jgi:EEF1A lysine methyltransferase 1
MHKTFDMAVIDPPFITREVWQKYTEAAHLLLKEDGKLLCSTIDENKEFMAELLNVKPIVFRPSIPNLVYQYSFYTNY